MNSTTLPRIPAIPSARLRVSEDGHTEPEQLLDLLLDADARRGSTGLEYLAEHTRAADLTDLAAAKPDPSQITRAEVEIAELSEGTAVLYKQYGDTLKVALPPVHDLDQVKTAISVFVSPEAAALITSPATPTNFIVPATFATDQPLGSDHPDAKVEAIDMAFRAMDEKGPTAGELVAALNHVRWSYPFAVVQEIADAIEHNLKATAALPTMRQLEAAEEITRYVTESPDPAAAAGRFLELIEAEKNPPVYVPPTECDVAERVTCAGAKGAFLNAYLWTPDDNEPDAPTLLSVYSEPSADDDLDLDGARRLRADLAALLPKLDVMIDVLAEQAQR